MIATVVYRVPSERFESDGLNECNCFNVEYNGHLTLGHLMKKFPLGLSYQLSVKDSNGAFVTLSNPASRVPISNGIVTAVATALADIPRVSIQAVKKEEISVSAIPTKPQEKSFVSPKASNATIKTKSRTSEQRPLDANSSEYIWGPDSMAINMQQVNKNVTKVANGLFKIVEDAASWASEQFNAEEIVLAARKVTKVKELAEGGFSKVFLVRDGSSKELFAMKEILCQDKDSIVVAKLEVEVLKAISHSSVIQLVDHAIISSKSHQSNACIFFLLFPFYSRGTAWDAITSASLSGTWPFPEAVALRVFRDACSGVHAMHKAGWAHRDIKPLNILISDSGKGILMDLGSAAPVKREVTSRQDALNLEDEATRMCSAPYRPPELMHINPGMKLDGRVDVWALGCTLYALAFGSSPFESPRDGVQKLGIINGKFNFPSDFRNTSGCVFSRGFYSLIKWMLNPDHSSRPQISQVLDRLSKVLDGNKV